MSKEPVLTSQRLFEAYDVLSALGEQFSQLPEEKLKATQAFGFLTIAGSYLSDYTHALIVRKLDPYDAALSAVRGDTKLPESPALTSFQLQTLMMNNPELKDGGENDEL